MITNIAIFSFVGKRVLTKLEASKSDDEKILKPLDDQVESGTEDKVQIEDSQNEEKQPSRRQRKQLNRKKSETTEETIQRGGSNNSIGASNDNSINTLSNESSDTTNVVRLVTKSGSYTKARQLNWFDETSSSVNDPIVFETVGIFPAGLEKSKMRASFIEFAKKVSSSKRFMIDLSTGDGEGYAYMEIVEYYETIVSTLFLVCMMLSYKSLDKALVEGTFNEERTKRLFGKLSFIVNDNIRPNTRATSNALDRLVDELGFHFLPEAIVNEIIMAATPKFSNREGRETIIFPSVMMIMPEGLGEAITDISNVPIYVGHFPNDPNLRTGSGSANRRFVNLINYSYLRLRQANEPNTKLNSLRSTLQAITPEQSLRGKIPDSVPYVMLPQFSDVLGPMIEPVTAEESLGRVKVDENDSAFTWPCIRFPLGNKLLENPPLQVVNDNFGDLRVTAFADEYDEERRIMPSAILSTNGGEISIENSKSIAISWVDMLEAEDVNIIGEGYKLKMPAPFGAIGPFHTEEFSFETSIDLIFSRKDQINRYQSIDRERVVFVKEIASDIPDSTEPILSFGIVYQSSGLLSKFEVNNMALVEDTTLEWFVKAWDSPTLDKTYADNLTSGLAYNKLGYQALKDYLNEKGM